VYLLLLDMGSYVSLNRCNFRSSKWSRCSEFCLKESGGGYCSIHGCYECGNNITKGNSIHVSRVNPMTVLYDRDGSSDRWSCYNLCGDCENSDKYHRCKGCFRPFVRVMREVDVCYRCTYDT
jgi:hypothetical protein